MMNFLRNLGLTKQDAVVIGFILITLVSGLVIKAFGWKENISFDYSYQDRKFEQMLGTSFSEIEKRSLSPGKKEKLNELRGISDSLLSVYEKHSEKNNPLAPGEKININIAYVSDLKVLPGIGQMTAERIVEYRERNKGFRKKEELMNVKGIGEKKFQKIKDLITVE